jgi:hypothetical protein
LGKYILLFYYKMKYLFAQQNSYPITGQKQKLNENYLSLNNNSLNIGMMVPSLVSPTALTILARQTLQ